MPPFSRQGGVRRSGPLLPLLAALSILGAGCAPLEREPPLQEEMSRLLREGTRAQSQGQGLQAEEAFRRALELAQVLQDGVAQAEIRLHLGRLAAARRAWEESFAQFTQAERLAGENGAPALVDQARCGLGEIHLRRGELDAARRRFTQVLESPSRSGQSLAGRIQALNGLALIDKEAGDIPQGLERLKEAEGLTGGGASVELRAALLLNRSALLLAGERIAEAEPPARQALELFKSREDLPGMAAASVQLGRLARRLGRQSEADEWEERAARIQRFLER